MEPLNERDQYGEDRKNADKLLPIQHHLSCLLFTSSDYVVADEKTDLTEVCDLLLDSKIFKVSLRIRETINPFNQFPGFARFWGEVTFRYPAEWHKVCEGEGDWMLYLWHDGPANLATMREVRGWSLIWLPGIRAVLADQKTMKAEALALIAAGNDVRGTAMLERYANICDCFFIKQPERAGQNPFMCVKVMKLQSMGYNIIDATTDERMNVEASKMYSINGMKL